MAANFTDEEREERINLIGEYFINNPGVSTRKIAEYFSKNFFKISNATVLDYINRYKKNNNLTDEIDNKLNENKPKTINDADVKKRVLTCAKLYISGKTLEEISNITNTNYWIIYRDLMVRLEKIDKEMYDQVIILASTRSNENLIQNSIKSK